MAQQTLFESYKRKVMAICVRYFPDRSEAADVFQESFIKIFGSFSNESRQEIRSLPAWIHRLTVNTAINAYRSRKSRDEIFSGVFTDMLTDDAVDILSAIHTEELLVLIQKLPAGYRVVFNLYMIEGYDHNEIAQQLGIQPSTSRSQLTLAKAWLQKRILKQNVAS